MEKVLHNEDELNARVYQFPQAMIKQNGKKINYYDFLMEGAYEACNQALLRIFPRIHTAQISGFIQNVPFITEQQKLFYETYVTARYKKILTPAYHRLIR